MSSTVCQRLTSCLEQSLTEPRPSIDKLTLPRSVFSQSTSFQYSPKRDANDTDNNDNKKPETVPDGNDNRDGELGWRSFIQALATPVAETEQGYIHPLVKRASSALSTKSLEMCTESLGSETGSNIDGIIDDLSNHSLEKQGCPQLQRSKKMNRTISWFPPPLTSISGSETTRVRPHRECGRLILTAISSSNYYLHAERADGRLRLYSPMEDEHVSQEDCTDEFENGIGGHKEVDNVESDDDDVDDLGIETESDYLKEDMEDINDGNFDCEVGMEEFPRPSRSCKEGGPRKIGTLSWGSFRVAIS